MFVELLNIIGVSALISGLALFIGKLWIQNAFKSKYDKELETLKSELKLVEAKQNVVFSKLHHDRAEAIADIYALLKVVHLNIQRCMSNFRLAGQESEETSWQNFYKSWNEYIDFYPKKIIFLPKSTAEKLEKVSQELIIALISYQTKNHSSPYGVEQRQEKLDSIMQKIRTILDPLEDDFRKLLGDE